MRAFLFKHKRRRNGKVVTGRTWTARIKLSGAAKHRDFPLRVTSKDVANQKLNDLIKELEREAAGLQPARKLRESATRPASQHIEDFLDDLHAKGRDSRYLYNLRLRINRVFRECHWKALKDVSADGFVHWRAAAEHAPKTLNDYLTAISGLFVWLERQGRWEVNPFKQVGMVKVITDPFRRAYSDDEMRRLLAVAGPRALIYLVAVNTGFRRGELKSLRRCDCDLYCEFPYLAVRASATKNGKAVAMPVFGEALDALRKVIPKGDRTATRVFPTMPKMKTVKADLARAGIPVEDAAGKRVDFHALRHTFVTNMTRTGASLTVVMNLARHSDSKLTCKTYADAALLPQLEALQRLPQFGSGQDTQIGTQTGVKVCPNVSKQVTNPVKANGDKAPVNKGESVDFAGGFAKEKMVDAAGFEPATPTV